MQNDTPKQYLAKLVERIVRSFIVGVASTWVTLTAVTDTAHPHTWQYFVGGALAGGGSAVLGVLGKPFGDPDSPSILPVPQPAVSPVAVPAAVDPVVPSDPVDPEFTDLLALQSGDPA